VKSFKMLDKNNLIYSIEACRILGMSKPTFNKHLMVGRYKVGRVRVPMGFKYSIYDIMKIAHPRLKDRDIEKLIFEYRLKRDELKRKRKELRQKKKAGGRK